MGSHPAGEGAPARSRAARRAGEGPFHASVRFGRVAGIEIGANWSWLIVVALIVWSLGVAVFPQENPGLSDATYAAMAVVAALLFFASLLLHELGHAIVAKREGMEIDGITLWVFGGVAKFKGMFPSAGAEFRIAIAGPLVTLVISAACISLAHFVALPDAVDGVVAWLGRINLLLLVFNMLPALPLDGGRVLRSALWRITGDFARATRIAGGLGRLFGQFLIAGGIALLLLVGVVGGLWLAFIGWFLVMAASAEANLVAARHALAGMKVSDAMAPHPATVPADMTLQAFMDDAFTRHRHSTYPVIEGGNAVGLLPFRGVGAVRPGEWPRLRVRDYMIPIDEALVVGPDDDLGDAVMDLAQTNVGRALVIDGERLEGILSMTDISRLLELKRLQPAAGKVSPPGSTAAAAGGR